MGKHFAHIAWSLVLVALLPRVTYANDTGPGKEVRAVRWTARTLLASRFASSGAVPGTIDVDSVNVNGSTAIANWSAGGRAGTSAFTWRYDRWWDDDGYAAALGSSLAKIATVSVRPPTEAESWHYFPGGDAWAFFTMQGIDGVEHRVDAGGTIAIWCPFVLDSGMRYSVTVAGADGPIGPLDVRVVNNTFDVVLPALTLPAGARLMGEIDGFPAR